MNSTTRQKPDRKPYRTPSLVRYGDLSRITNAVGMTGAKDVAMTGANRRTRP